MTIAQFPVPPIVKTVVVRAAPERVFALFTEDFARWWPLVLRFSHMIQPIPVRTGRRAVSSRWAANHPSDSVH
jgi:uncharacterized protein YndB with AHSA1/START domain